MQFKNTNNYTETSKVPFLGCLIFGFLYFAYKGIWRHALISFVLAILTGGLAWLVYPFFASGIVENNYLRNGWTLINQPTPKNFETPNKKPLIIFCLSFTFSVLLFTYFYK